MWKVSSSSGRSGLRNCWEKRDAAAAAPGPSCKRHRELAPPAKVFRRSAAGLSPTRSPGRSSPYRCPTRQMLSERVAHRICRRAPAATGQRGDRFGVHLEVAAQIFAIIAAPEAIGSQRLHAAGQPRRHLVGHHLHVIGGRDNWPFGAFQRLHDVRRPPAGPDAGGSSAPRSSASRRSSL